MEVDNMSPLLDIPLEVLLQITSYLTTSDYGNLRHVCRRLEESLLQSFTHEFFTKRQFMISEFSLGALVDISKSRFAPSLSHLIISIERPPIPPSLPVHMQVFSDVEQALRYNKMREEHMSHQALITTGRDLQLLTEALCNLPNLKTIGLRDFNSSGRYRDGADNTWHAYGAPTFLWETNYPLDQPRFGGRHLDSSLVESRIQYVSHVFLTMLRALGKAKETHSPTQLEVILRNCHLPSLAFNVPRYLESTITPFLKDLKTLFLDLGPASFSTLVINNGGNYQGYLGLTLVTFLSKTTSLEHLRLNFRSCAKDETRDLLQWLIRTPESPGGSKHQGIEHLEELEIGMITIEPSLLLSIYKRFKPSLRIISLHKVTFSIESQNQVADRVNLWASFFGQMAKLKFNLTVIRLSFLKQIHLMSPYSIEFKDKNHTSSDPISGTEWKGNDFERSSGELIDSMSVNWPPDQDMQEDSNTSPSEDDDDDIDDE
ncbi:F-box domain-containing protein [Daldinia childiae]|uniref:F-box domain-containing protein n=1 Tax=Daldinia childiae TaxID=326645 RepID=UPI001445FFA4|nr:F-box domain-containing protein [Daldinia childiae]KAF3062061.1 F-box domain-containing protein [Daldinia childiae]